jgi:hypothetical protein
MKEKEMNKERSKKRKKRKVRECVHGGDGENGEEDTAKVTVID